MSHSYTEQALGKCPVQILFVAVSKDESVTEVRYAVSFPYVEERYEILKPINFELSMGDLVQIVSSVGKIL